MAHHAPKTLNDIDKAVLAGKAWPGIRNLAVVGIVAFIVALVSTPFSAGSWDRLGFAYLIAFAFALSITLGCQFFVISTTLFRAGWHTAFSRIPEVMAANMPTVGALFVPILILVWAGNGTPYPWANPQMHAYADEHYGQDHAQLRPEDRANPLIRHVAGPAGREETADAPTPDTGAPAGTFHVEDPHHAPEDPDTPHGETHGAEHHVWGHTAEAWPDHDHAMPYFVHAKGPWYTAWFYSLRWVVYLGLWTLVGGYYLRRSVMQDKDKDPVHTNRREWWAPLSVIVFSLTITLASFDLVMAVDPVWYSTMFGVYYFAGCFIAGLSFIIITLMVGQRMNYFPSITTDHYHDLGKLLFAFVFFWGYVGFSQFMLIWYASIPETTYWWEIRGATSRPDAATYGGPWTVVAWTMLFAHLLLPFAILLSKHVKRNRTAMFTMACWMLAMCYLDLYWITMPAFSSPDIVFGLPEIGCAVGCVAIMLAGALRLASRHSLMAHGDPRLRESLGLDTTAWAPLHPAPGH